jgi:hypothetical protein
LEEVNMAKKEEKAVVEKKIELKAVEYYQDFKTLKVQVDDEIVYVDVEAKFDESDKEELKKLFQK